MCWWVKCELWRPGESSSISSWYVFHAQNKKLRGFWEDLEEDSRMEEDRKEERQQEVENQMQHLHVPCFAEVFGSCSWASIILIHIIIGIISFPLTSPSPWLGGCDGEVDGEDGRLRGRKYHCCINGSLLGWATKRHVEKGIFRPKFGSYGFPKFLIHLVRVLILNLHPYDRSLLANKTWACIMSHACLFWIVYVFEAWANSQCCVELFSSCNQCWGLTTLTQETEALEARLVPQKYPLVN